VEGCDDAGDQAATDTNLGQLKVMAPPTFGMGLTGPKLHIWGRVAWIKRFASFSLTQSFQKTRS